MWLKSNNCNCLGLLFIICILALGIHSNSNAQNNNSQVLDGIWEYEGFLVSISQTGSKIIINTYFPKIISCESNSKIMVVLEGQLQNNEITGAHWRCANSHFVNLCDHSPIYETTFKAFLPNENNISGSWLSRWYDEEKCDRRPEEDRYVNFTLVRYDPCLKLRKFVEAHVDIIEAYEQELNWFNRQADREVRMARENVQKLSEFMDEFEYKDMDNMANEAFKEAALKLGINAIAVPVGIAALIATLPHIGVPTAIVTVAHGANALSSVVSQLIRITTDLKLIEEMFAASEGEQWVESRKFAENNGLNKMLEFLNEIERISSSKSYISRMQSALNQNYQELDKIVTSIEQIESYLKEMRTELREYEEKLQKCEQANY